MNVADGEDVLEDEEFVGETRDERMEGLEVVMKLPQIAGAVSFCCLLYGVEGKWGVMLGRGAYFGLRYRRLAAGLHGRARRWR